MSHFVLCSRVKTSSIIAEGGQITATDQISYKSMPLISKPAILYGLSWCGMLPDPVYAACITKHGAENTSHSDRQDNLDLICMMYYSSYSEFLLLVLVSI